MREYKGFIIPNIIKMKGGFKFEKGKNYFIDHRKYGSENKATVMSLNLSNLIRDENGEKKFISISIPFKWNEFTGMTVTTANKYFTERVNHIIDMYYGDEKKIIENQLMNLTSELFRNRIDSKELIDKWYDELLSITDDKELIKTIINYSMISVQSQTEFILNKLIEKYD